MGETKPVDLTAQIETVRKLLDAKTECPAKYHKVASGKIGIAETFGCICEPDKGLRGTIPDPAYDPLRRVFEVDCKHDNSAWKDTAGFQAFCPECGAEWQPTPENVTAPSGYRPRSWEGLPIGALSGAIGCALGGALLARFSSSELWHCIHSYDDPATLEALIRALGE